MGKINKDHEKVIRKALSRRGLKPDLTYEWEVHGPHTGMNWPVYVGCAYTEAEEGEKCNCPGLRLVNCKAHIRRFYVAIYPRAVYELDEASDWYKADPENRLFVV
jgi:hypothetical protein